MSFDQIFRGGSISASGLSAEQLRMEVIANNIANAYATRTANGGPYRRQEVVFEAVMNQFRGNPQAQDLGGVRVVGTQEDPSEFPVVYRPGHPDANADGFLLMPNVVLPMEMVNLMTASRAYEANLKAMQTYRQQLEQSLVLLRY